jgi:methylmalonyl-CoA carboxyltransferase large subunit
MPTVTEIDLNAALEELRQQLAEMSQRVVELEARSAAPAPAPGPAAVRAEPKPAAITEEELLVISAAIGAYLGVRAHIRQIRLVGTTAWAQQGRVSIQASHRLQG